VPTPAEPRVLRGGPGDRRRHLRLPSLLAGQQRNYAGCVLAGAGRNVPDPEAGLRGQGHSSLCCRVPISESGSEG